MDFSATLADTPHTPILHVRRASRGVVFFFLSTGHFWFYVAQSIAFKGENV